MNAKYKEVKFTRTEYDSLKIKRDKAYFKARMVNKKIRKYVKNKLRSFNFDLGKIIFFGK